MLKGQKRRNLRLLALLLVLFVGLNSTRSALALDEAMRSQLSSAVFLSEQDLPANLDSIRILVRNCIDGLAPDDPICATLQSVLVLLDSGSANSEAIALLLHTAIDRYGTPAEEPESSQPTAPEETNQPDAPAPEVTATAAPLDAANSAPEMMPSEPDGKSIPENTYAEEPLEPSALGLPVFEVSAYVKTVFQDTMLVDVPQDWGNNASDSALTSYSPVNDSGAISPSAGTLTISYFPTEGEDDATAFDTYTKNIASMSVTTSLSFEDVTAAALPARRIDFTMSVGANQFSCETVCFAHQDTVYAIELMQGQQTEYDYFPVYHRVVKSAEIGDAASIAKARAQEEAVTLETQDQPATQPPEMEPSTSQETPEPVIEMPPESTEVPEETQGNMSGDLGTFQYAINGHIYTFPTSVRSIAKEDLPLQRDTTIPYDFSSDADMFGGSWTEIVNTQYYYFENAQHKEIAGVTNMSGYPVSVLDCMLTALIDTAGTYVNVILPGGVRIGGQESDILRAFPEFADKPLDGLAEFRGNELLYACNVRDDGCDGYVLIRNDEPYYSAVSIICEHGVIREISFECLGSVRAQGIFLD